eukprot:CAMPEP_0176501084 /NCGR_PEP_ID=MMETSP0200_2-20121128/13959_1 /TAXON_ID=947934 /ORGANISM="Chaetoceros sp., Strain GSL56" /LENGTH=630 /DNA_ID=CAMNT_0017899921 /DNA_START=242 /DNA_END=2134 /DNA_ORIENTATION=-
MDIIKVTDQDTNASFNCWISAVESILLDGMMEPITSCTAKCPYSSCSHQQEDEHHHQSRHIISPGTNFCSTLTNIQKKVLALQLTKCYLEESNRFVSLPESCQMENLLQGNNRNTSTSTSSKSTRSNAKIRQCLFDLSNEGFLIYTQFYLHTDLACTKLTGELVIHRNLEVVTKFQETALMMEQRVRKALILQQGIILDMVEQKELLERQSGIIQNMEMNIDVARQNMISYNSFVEEQEQAIVSLMEKMCSNNRLKQMLTISQQTVDAIEKYGGTYGIFLVGRLILLLLMSIFVVLFLFPSRRFVLKVMCTLTMLDVAIEYIARYHDHEFSSVLHDLNLYEFVMHQRQKRVDAFVYFVVMLLSWIGNRIYSSIKTKRSTAATVNDATLLTKKDIQDILYNMEQQRVESKRHEDEIRQHLASLQRQLLLILPPPNTNNNMKPMSSGTDAVPTSTPSNTVKYATINDQHIGSRARYATPTPTAGYDWSNDSRNDEDNHSIALASCDKMPIVTPSTHLPSRLASRDSCHEQEQVNGVTIPTSFSCSVESPLASPNKSSKVPDEKITEREEAGNHHKRKHDCDSDTCSDHSHLQVGFKRQRNNSSNDKDDDEEEDGDVSSNSSNHNNYHHHDES